MWVEFVGLGRIQFNYKDLQELQDWWCQYQPITLPRKLTWNLKMMNHLEVHGINQSMIWNWAPSKGCKWIKQYEKLGPFHASVSGMGGRSVPLTIARTFSITSAFGGPKRDEFLLDVFGTSWDGSRGLIGWLDDHPGHKFHGWSHQRWWLNCNRGQSSPPKNARKIFRLRD